MWWGVILQSAPKMTLELWGWSRQWGHLGRRWHGSTSQWGPSSCKAGPSVAAPAGMLGSPGSIPSGFPCLALPWKVMSLPGVCGSRGPHSCLGLAAAVIPSLDSTAVLVGFAWETAGFAAGVMARGCLGRKWGSWLAAPSRWHCQCLPHLTGHTRAGACSASPKAPPLPV